MEISHYLRIDRDSALPLAVQLAQQLRWLIVRGQASVGDRLPPVRQLADELGINMHTARAAYQDLSRAGLITSRPGTGTTKGGKGKGSCGHQETGAHRPNRQPRAPGSDLQPEQGAE